MRSCAFLMKQMERVTFFFYNKWRNIKFNARALELAKIIIYIFFMYKLRVKHTHI